MTADPEKARWGQRNYGVPASQIKAALSELLSTSEFAGLRRDALACYFDKLIAQGLPYVLQTELTVGDLKALSPPSVKAAQVMLIRDFLRRYRDRMIDESLVPENMRGWQWVEMFTVRLLEASDTPVEPYVQWITRQKEGEAEDSRVVVTGLAAQLRMNPKTLWDFHLAMCKVVEEDVLDAAKPTPAEPSVDPVRVNVSRPMRSEPQPIKQEPVARWESALKRLLATITGVAVAVALVAGNEYVGSRFFPLPATLNLHDTAAVNAFIASLPVTALLVVLFGWFLATFVGGCVALRLAKGAGNRPAWMVALALMVAALLDLASFVHPVWFWIAALLLIPGAAALAGAACGRRDR